MKRLNEYPLAELKLMYRTLHGSLMREVELIDSELMQDLQSYLQRQATAAGVVIADHGAWDAWLGNAATTCDQRMQGRRCTE